MSEEVTPQGEDIDALYDKIMGKDGPTMSEETATQTAAPAQTPTESEFEFIHNGKQIKATRDQLIKWAQQGYDYPQKMAEVNRIKQEILAERQKAEGLYKTYAPIDEWVSQNQDKWAKLQQAIQVEQAGGAEVPPALLAKMRALEEGLGKATQFISQAEQEKQAARVQKEDEGLAQDVQSIRDKYKDLDWTSRDEQGRDLEYRVLEHATENGINSFRAAFHDMLHEELVKAAEARGREALTKERAAKQSQGLLGQTPTPTKGLLKAQNHKNKSYEDLKNEALAELGIQV